MILKDNYLFQIQNEILKSSREKVLNCDMDSEELNAKLQESFDAVEALMASTDAKWSQGKQKLTQMKAYHTFHLKVAEVSRDNLQWLSLPISLTYTNLLLSSIPDNGMVGEPERRPGRLVFPRMRGSELADLPVRDRLVDPEARRVRQVAGPAAESLCRPPRRGRLPGHRQLPEACHREGRP